jgi:hypothetical protein
MLTYNFFDYKDFIPDEDKQNVMWSTEHIVFIILAVLAIILLCYFLRNIKGKSVDKYLKILAIIMPVLEIIKITWETYWDIKLGHGFNITGLLPLYTCSMFIYVLPFAGWGKGKVKECALAFLTTLSVFAGLTNFFIPPIFNTYPFFSYASFMSLNYHFLMVFTGVFLVATRYYVPNFKSILKGFIPLLIFSVIVIPFDYIMFYNGHYWIDYMLYIHGFGAPLLPSIADKLGSLNLRGLYTILVMGGYLLIDCIFVSIYQLIFKVFKIKQINKSKGESDE